MREITVSVGGKHNAKVQKTWCGTFAQFVASLLSKVPETMDKASNGWVCGAEFDPAYRDSENFVARHLLSLDYDHITPEEAVRLLDHYRGNAHLTYTTWTHNVSKPRLRVWLPLSRPCSYDEFQAVSRRVAADAGIELAARESHTPAQYMFRPAVKPFEEFQHWENLEGPWVDVDAVLATYEDWTDRTTWPHRAEGDGVHNEGAGTDPRAKPGVIGAFCRAFTISDAIDRFDLPYKPGSAAGRLTYTDGSRPDGAIIYDDDTKLHSHHDTDPARGQTNAFDLTRLHKFGSLDWVADGVPLAQRPSSQKMAEFAGGLEEVRNQLAADAGFVDLDEADAIADTGWLDGNSDATGGGGLEASSVLCTPPPSLPERIKSASSKRTDQENARRIQRRYGDKLISIGGTFYYWRGTHWAQDEPMAFISCTALSQIVKAEVDKLEEELNEKASKDGRQLTNDEVARVVNLRQWGDECGQLSKINSCRTILRETLAFKSELLNRSAHLFSCANGTIDLRTGEMHAHDPKEFITASSPIAYEVTAEAPRFRKFLAEIFNGDQDVIAFAQRWFGYCITGDISEHKMLFHVGGGGNGKSTLMDLLRFVLGPDYYSTAPGNLLTLEVKGASPELADLLGRRMITIAETEESLEMREGLVKQITGGDPIKARMLYKSHFEFLPTHKLQVFTNFRPQIKGQDFAIWRRILLLDYPNSYGDAIQVARGEAQLLGDPKLEKALQSEAPGVLRWLVEGARAWYESRLEPPAVVLDTTAKYRTEQDRPRQFAIERLEADPSARTALAGAAESVYPAYRGWCSGMGYHPLSRTRFQNEMLRVIPTAKLATWKEGTATIYGFTGFKLTASGFLD